MQALAILDKAFRTMALASSLVLHPGKVVVIPLWKFVESDVREAIRAVAPGLAAARIQDHGKLLGVFVGPGAPQRQWSSVRQELRERSRFLASLGMAWSGVMPLFRSHVLPVASHLAQMCPMPASLLRTVESCMAIVLKTPFRAVPGKVLYHAKSFGLGIDVPDLRTLGLAATFRAADASGVLTEVISEHVRARASRDTKLSPFLREWTNAGVVGHMRDTSRLLKDRFNVPPPAGSGLQAWVVKEIRQGTGLDEPDLAFRSRISGGTSSPRSHPRAPLSHARSKRLCASGGHVVGD